MTLVTEAGPAFERSIIEYLAQMSIPVYVGARKEKDIKALNSVNNVIALKNTLMS